MEKLNTTPRANQVLDRAQKLAIQKGHSYVGTEHIFLAILDERSPMIEQMLLAALPSPQELRNRCFQTFERECGEKKQNAYADLDFKVAAKMLEDLAHILKNMIATVRE